MARAASIASSNAIGTPSESDGITNRSAQARTFRHQAAGRADEPVADAERRCSCCEHRVQLAASCNGDMQPWEALGEHRERIHQVHVPLHGIEVADGHGELIVCTERQLASQELVASGAGRAPFGIVRTVMD